MLEKLLHHKIRIGLALFLVLLLVLVRAYEESLFYDPLLLFFKGDYHHLPVPELDIMHLFLGLFFRYSLNSVISLAIIYVLFRDREALAFASVLYLLFFVILMLFFFFVLFYFDTVNVMTLFYVRRFLIQPLFLLLFVPAFYYQKKITN